MAAYAIFVEGAGLAKSAVARALGVAAARATAVAMRLIAATRIVCVLDREGRARAVFEDIGALLLRARRARRVARRVAADAIGTMARRAVHVLGAGFALSENARALGVAAACATAGAMRVVAATRIGGVFDAFDAARAVLLCPGRLAARVACAVARRVAADAIGTMARRALGRGAACDARFLDEHARSLVAPAPLGAVVVQRAGLAHFA